MLKLINGATSLRREFLEPDPDEESTAHVMPLRTRFAALAAFQAGDLLAFAVPLRDLPAEAARLLGGLGRILRQVVRDDKVRAVGRHLNPEQGPLGVFGKAFALDALAVGQGLGVPGTRRDTPIRLWTPGVIDLAIGLKRTGVYCRE